MKTLQNKTAVITGGNSGIGLATAKTFASEGAKVAITGRNTETLDKAVDAIGHDAIGFESDVLHLEKLSETFERIQGEFGKIDVLVVNAGIAVAGALADYTEEDFDRTSDINFKGTFFTVQKALPYLNDGASVILTASATNERGFAGFAAYAATKAAIRSLARSFSTELMDRGIRVNALSPGAIDTPFYGRNGSSPEEIESSKNYMAESMIPAKRLGTSEEVAAAFLFLASDASKYMMGSELVMDGGVKTL